MLSLKTTVETYRGTLTASEKRLVHALLSDPTEAALLSAAELSARAEVHQATAVRLAQKLGYRGYPELRAQLQSDLLKGEPAARLQRRLERSEGGVLEALISSEIAALQALTSYVSQAQLDEAARLLIGARRVFLFAQGHATSLAELLSRRLRRSGFEVGVLSPFGRDLAEGVLALGEGDALLAFAFHREPKGLGALLAHAQGVGARTVLVSDLLGTTLRPAPDVLLAAPRGAEQEFTTLSVPMALVNALVLTVAQLDDGRSVRSLERLAGLLAHLDEPPPHTP